jgi:hypothetical protein
MDQRVPDILCPLLEEYIGRIKQDLGGQISAFYLEGSIALGEFNPQRSDIDFIAVLDNYATPSGFKKIEQIHRALEQKYPWKMSGMYFQARDLGCKEHTHDPFPNFHDGRLNWAYHFELSSVTWWILKNRAIAVFGPPTSSLPIAVDMDHLIDVQQKNLNTYWAGWTKRPGRILVLTSDWGIQWSVLGVLRQFYTIREHQITSKIKAGEYGLSCLPERWHAIIREAIAIRQASRLSYYRSRIKRAFDAFHFIKYVIQSCKE